MVPLYEAIGSYVYHPRSSYYGLLHPDGNAVIYLASDFQASTGLNAHAYQHPEPHSNDISQYFLISKKYKQQLRCPGLLITNEIFKYLGQALPKNNLYPYWGIHPPAKLGQ